MGAVISFLTTPGPTLLPATQPKLNECKWTALDYSPCCPDLSKCGFYLFGLLKKKDLNVKQFSNDKTSAIRYEQVQ